MDKFKILNKNEKPVSEKQYSITLLSQKKLALTGVDEIYSSNDKLISLKTNGKKLIITGENINISKLNIDTGELEATGNIDSIKYSTNIKVGLLKRLFK